MKKNKVQNQCVVCRLTTNNSASNKKGSVQCTICDSWWHMKCAGISPDMLAMITKCMESGMDNPWKCQACGKAMAKLNKRVKAINTQVEDNKRELVEHSGRMDRMEDKGKVRDSRLECQQKEIDQLKDQLEKLGEASGPSAFREMDERAGKENNLVFHRVEESGEGEARARIGYDKLILQQILNVMGMELHVEEDIKFVRRLGARDRDMDTGKREPRPLLIGLVHKHYAEGILQNSWKLGKASDEAYRYVSVVKDLTMKQRNGERELYKEASRKNLTRTQEQMEENMAFKVVGRRGSKREILAPLRQGESINREGEVVWAEEETMRDRGTVRGRGGEVTTYPNCTPVGRAGGTWGRNQDTLLGPIQAKGRGGGSGSVSGVTPASREQLQRATLGRGGRGGVKRTGERDVRLRGGRTLDNRSPPLKRLNTKSSPTTNKRLNIKFKSSPTASRDDKEPSTSHNMSKGMNLLERVEETDTAGEDEDEEGGGTEEEEVEEEDTAGE